MNSKSFQRINRDATKRLQRRGQVCVGKPGIRTMWLVLLAAGGFCLWAGFDAACWAEEERIDFARDIRPILSNNCFTCHGPDAAERQGGLRLDLQTGAHGAGESGEIAVRPGQPELSELYQRVTSTDDSLRMPPGPGMGLSPEDQQKLREWIRQGAEYAEHWAYQPLRRPELPGVQQADWPRHPLDHFILNRLERAGIAPRPEASRQTWIRRVSLDLTGLPPTPEEVDQFLADDSPQAYERVVDRLLASPAYGEHWARMWLDLARYADSAGYADDPPRTIWAFRDYVIQSLNDNKPFDQFTLEQLAGDLLPSPTDEQLIATAFHRNTLTNSEGGTDDEEFRNAAVVDRVNTTFAVWMGTTMACAQCHTHKYDPITQQEYFEVFAIFNNTADADRKDEAPVLRYFTAEQKQQQQAWREELADLRKTLATPTPALLEDWQAWRQRLSQPLKLREPVVQQVHSTPPTEIRIDEGIVSLPQPPEQATYQLQLTPPETPLQWTGLQIESLPPESGNGTNYVITRVSATISPRDKSPQRARRLRIELPGAGKILSLAEVEVFSKGKNIAPDGTAQQSSTAYEGGASRAIDGNTSGDYFAAQSTTHTEISDDPWWELTWPAAVPIERIVVWNRTDGNTGNRLTDYRVILLNDADEEIWSEQSKTAPQPQATFQPSRHREVPLHQAFADYHQSGFEPAFVLDENEPNKRGFAVGGQTDRPHQLNLIARQPFSLAEDEILQVNIEQQSQYKQHTLSRFQVRLTADERALELAQIPSEFRSLLSQTAEVTADEEARLQTYYLKELAPGLASERARFRQLEKSLAETAPYTTVPYMVELPADKRRTTHIQLRGNFLALGEQVQPGLPAAFHPWNPSRTAADSAAGKSVDSQFPTRLDLAQWLMSPENALTPRVIANRYWEKLFGQGLVVTSEEFGSQGELPSHPELLDWLGTELQQLGWDTKAFLRQLVLSATYRQSSAVTPELLEADPGNRWLSRGPRFRLSAEMVRDQALFVAGLLSPKQFGPPVNPPQPKLGLNAAFGSGIDWKTSEGEDRFRRGLYTSWRRSNPYPSMTAFDAPNREVCTVRRDRTNTPLQAFVTLNDPVFVEAAQGLAQRIAALPQETPEKIAQAYRICLSRLPSEQESARLQALYESARELYEQRPEQARQLATNPSGSWPDELQTTDAEAAAWTLVANVLLNLDEFLMKP